MIKHKYIHSYAQLFEATSDTDDLKTKSLLFFDFGQAFSTAEFLANKFGKVYYYVVWEQSYPSILTYGPGYGFDNIIKITDPWEVIDNVDIIFFPDVHNGGLQQWLRDNKYNVWGCGSGEQIEIDKIFLKKFLEQANLPTSKYKIIKGFDALERLLKEKNNVWVKVLKYRMDAETFHSKNYENIKSFLTTLKYRLGPALNYMDFLVEEAIDTKIEIGYDGYFVNGNYPSIALAGLEVKNSFYFGQIRKYDDLPKQVTNFTEAIKPYLTKINYNNFLSTEVRVKDNVDYVIDITTRIPSPPGALYQVMYKNYADIIYNGARGILIDPIPKYKWGIQLMLKHEDGVEPSWKTIKYPDKIKDFVYLHNPLIGKKDKAKYVIPKEYMYIGSVMGVGDTLEEALEHINKNVELIEAYDMKYEKDIKGKIDEILKELKANKIKYFD